MLKKKLGIECIELDWNERFDFIYDYYKIPSTLIIPKGCMKVGRSAFEGCKKLRKVEISGNVDWINSNAFRGCTKATIILKKPESEFKYIGKDAFIRCKSVEYAEEKTRN